jgi:ankyrin repeat protein
MEAAAIGRVEDEDQLHPIENILSPKFDPAIHPPLYCPLLSPILASNYSPIRTERITAAFIAAINAENNYLSDDMVTQRVQTTLKILTILTQPIKEEIDSLQQALTSSEQELQLLQLERKASKVKLQLNCKPFIMNPPDDNDPIITQFMPAYGQWKLNSQNIKRIDPSSRHTILHNYCTNIKSSPFEVFRYLIETKGCNINGTDNNNNTPIHIVLHSIKLNDSSDPNALTYLLYHKDINLSIKNDTGFTLLHSACSNINSLPLDIFKHLIETKGMGINVQDKMKNIPIYIALDNFEPKNGGDVKILTYLLNQKGIDANIKGQHGRTLLHWSCCKISHLSLDIFKRLIETKRCDINAQDNQCNTPLHYALRHFQSDIADLSILTYLFNQKGLKINLKGHRGHTLLHSACENPTPLPIWVFRYLIETKGIDINVQDDHHDTPLHLFLSQFKSEGHDTSTLTYLLNQKGLNVSTKGQYGYNLLHSACLNINVLPLEIFKDLIETKGVKLETIHGDTPLHLLMDHILSKPDSSVSQITQYLIQQGVQVNQKNSGQYSAFDHFLSSTSSQEHPLTYEVFIQNGAETQEEGFEDDFYDDFYDDFDEI